MAKENKIKKLISIDPQVVSDADRLVYSKNYTKHKSVSALIEDLLRKHLRKNGQNLT